MYRYCTHSRTVLASRDFAPFPALPPEQESLLPTHKLELKALEKLRTLNPDEMSPLVEFLLTWLQDVNWPIALPVAELLRLPRYNQVVGKAGMDILLLEKNDATWRNYILQHVVLPLVENGELVDGEGEWKGLKGELERLVREPTREEREDWEMDGMAREVLVGWKVREGDGDENEELEGGRGKVDEVE